MNEQAIKQLIQNEIQNYLPTFGNLAVPTHTHNGVDSLRVKSADLYPYPVNQPINYFTPADIGTITLFDFSNTPNPVDDSTQYYWGINTFLGFDNDGTSVRQSWAEINMADFYVDATQDTPQTISANSPLTIVFDTMNFQKPYGSYDDFVNPIDGQFKVINGLNGQPCIYGATSVPIWYMVTASVGLVPSGAVAGESADIVVFVDGVAIHYNRFYFPTATDSITATISVLMNTPITQELHIDIYNNSANTVDTVANPQVTFLKVKQLK